MLTSLHTPLRACALGAATLAALLQLSACGATGDEASAGDRAGLLRVTTNFYPVEEAARAIGGSDVSVTDLTPVGGEPHDLELKARAVAALEKSDLVLYLGNGFQPQVEKAVASLPGSVRRTDLLKGIKLRPAQHGIPGVVGQVDGGAGGPEALAGDKDPHVWVDPTRWITMTERIRDSLISADPQHRADFEARATSYLKTIQALDQDFARELKNCASPVLVTSHAAFGYLADHYGLTQAAIAGVSPDEEPDPRSLAALATFARAHDVTTVYFETLVPRKLAQTVARTIGARTDALNPVEGLTRSELDAGRDYVSIQRDNLAAMVKGLRCTGA